MKFTEKYYQNYSCRISVFRSILRIVIIILPLTLSACLFEEVEEFDPSQCLSGDFFRYQVGDAIFDIPKSINILDNLTEDQKEKFYIKMPVEYQRFTTHCQSIDHVPIRVGTRFRDTPTQTLWFYFGNLNHIPQGSVTIYEKSAFLKTRDGLQLANNMFNMDDRKITISRLPQNFPSPSRGEYFDVMFSQNHKKQVGYCHASGCKYIYFSGDGVVYKLSPFFLKRLHGRLERPSWRSGPHSLYWSPEILKLFEPDIWRLLYTARGYRRRDLEGRGDVDVQ
ncbi:hypothetical protein ACFQ14_05815 [Pseudahrensia aquimaris]|uniref:DKNYY family protein n=1 Tax=Pseudahrensia aquimaris TaxID=744461 RepID=A0ABW3FBS5_9HYPH